MTYLLYIQSRCDNYQPTLTVIAFRLVLIQAHIHHTAGFIAVRTIFGKETVLWLSSCGVLIVGSVALSASFFPLGILERNSGWVRGERERVRAGVNLGVIVVRACEPALRNLPHSYTRSLKKYTFHILHRPKC